MLHPQSDGTIPTEVQLIPIGKIQGRDSRSFCLNNIDEVIKNSIARFNPSKDSNSLDLVIDYEHQTFNSEKNGEPAPAAGWIKQLLNKGSQGLWGVVDWTAKARELIQNKEYRYLSPVFTHDKQGNIIALQCAGLTNYPNLELQSFNKLDETSNLKENKPVNQLLATLCLVLGMPESSSEQAVVDEVKKLIATSQNTPALNKIASALGIAKADEQEILTAINTQKTQHVEVDKFVALNKQFEDLKQEVAKDKAQMAVNKAVSDGLLPPALKDNALAIFQSLGEPAYNDFIGKMPQLAINKETAPKGKAPESNAELSNEAVAMCKQFGLSLEDYKKTLNEEKTNANI